MRSDQALQRLYAKFNKQYFNNKLPSLVVGYRSSRYFKKYYPHSKASEMRTVAVTEFHKPTKDPIAIYLDKIYCNRDLDLLHEMVHVKLGFDEEAHGEKFDREMLRLAKAGAFHNVW